MIKIIEKLYLNNRGQGLVEYGLIIALVILVVFASLHDFSDEVKHIFNIIEEETSGVM